MSLIFKENGHVYESIDPNEQIKWTSVTSLVGLLKPKFNSIEQSEKSAKNKKSKWYGMKPEEIRNVWTNETLRAVNLGSFYHNQRERDLLECDTIQREGFDLPIIPPKVMNGIKYAPEQKLINGIYPEHFVYLKSAGICGQADRVEVVNNYVNIYDYKTNKEIKTEGYVSWDGKRDTMDFPIAHLDNCNLKHYTLQMSIYMYMILKHNPKLKPGRMVIEHIVFEKEGDDQYGYPITKYSKNGDPIVKEIVPYEVPYLKDEVMAIINWIKDNKDDIRS